MYGKSAWGNVSHESFKHGVCAEISHMWYSIKVFFRRKETSWIIDWRKCKMNIMYFWTVSWNTYTHSVSEWVGTTTPTTNDEQRVKNVFPSNVKCACYACGCVHLNFLRLWVTSCCEVQESCRTLDAWKTLFFLLFRGISDDFLLDITKKKRSHRTCMHVWIWNGYQKM